MRIKTQLSAAALAVSAIFLAASSTVASADDLYTSEAAFAAATTNLTTFTFTACGSTCFTDYTSYTEPVTGTVFSLATPYIDLTGADYYGPGIYPMDFLIESASASPVANTLTVTPPGGYSAIGFELGSFNGGPFTATLSDGSAFVISPPAFNGLGFYGFTSNSPITSLELSIPTVDTFVIDEGYLADNAAATPEPGSLILLGTGLLGLGQMVRRKMAA